MLDKNINTVSTLRKISKVMSGQNKQAQGKESVANTVMGDFPLDAVITIGE